MSTTSFVECESCGYPIMRGRISCGHCGAAATARAGRITPEWEKSEEWVEFLKSYPKDRFLDCYYSLRNRAVETAGAYINNVSIEYPMVDIEAFHKRAMMKGVSLSKVRVNGLIRFLAVQQGSIELSVFEISEEYLELVERKHERARVRWAQARNEEWREMQEAERRLLAEYEEELTAYNQLPIWKRLRKDRPKKPRR